MTIKQRLYISNILMVVVPVLISIFVFVVGIYFTVKMAAQHNESIYAKMKYEEFQGDLTENIEKLIGNKNKKETRDLLVRVESILKENDAQLLIYQDGKKIFKAGSRHKDEKANALIKDMLKAKGSGTVTIGETDLFCEELQIESEKYTVGLVSPTYDILFDDYIQMGMKVLLALGIAVIAAVFLTCYFLSRFVLRKIKKPLDILAAGVGEIRDGNLEYRIHYEGEDEFAPVCNAFNEMGQHLKASVEETRNHENNRKELLAGISHDLRTPLTSINAYVEGILDGVANTPEKQTHYIKIIQKRAMEINKMVEQLFLFSKLDLGEYPFRFEHLNIGKILSEIIQSNIVEYDKKGLTLYLENPEEDLVINGDAVQLQNVFLNVISNSLKYKDKPQGTLRISCKREGNQAVIVMTDDGPGIPPADIERVFQTFYRCDPSRKDSGQGSGLGLAICAKTLERMKGTITAQNAEEGGLVLIIRLPLNEEK